MIPATARTRALPALGFALWSLIMTAMLLAGMQLWSGGARIQSDILAMLPKLQQDALTERALTRVEARLANRLYLALIAPNEAEAIAAGKQLLEALYAANQGEAAPFIEIGSADSHTAEALSRFYFSHRFRLLTPEQAEALQAGDTDTLLARATEQLYSALGFANSALLSDDPLLLYPANLQALAPPGQLATRDGILLAKTGDRVGAIVQAQGRGSVFDPDAQAAQLALLETALADLALSHPTLEILRAGALFHARAATQSARAEISLIGLVSACGVMLLVWLAFRSIMPLLLAALTLISGFLFACVATLALFGELQLLTLVFGTSLIGIAIDYSFHFYCERLQHPKLDARGAVARIFPAVSLALLTSALAYLAIGFTPFPGMQQVAIFCAAGLLGAYLTLLLAYPLLATGDLPHGGTRLALAGRYLALTRRAHLPPARAVPAALLIAALLLIGLMSLDSDDDIRNLQHSPASVTNPEDKLRALLSGGTDNQFLLVRAGSEDALMQRLETLTPTLQEAVDARELGNFISPGRFLPSRATQERNYELQGQVYRERLDGILAALGLDERLAEPLRRAYGEADGDFMTAGAFFAGAGSELATLWLAPAGQDTTAENAVQEHGAIVLLGGIKDIGAIRDRFAPIPGVQLVDKVGSISTVMGQYRRLTLLLLLLALAMATLVFRMRFGLRLACLTVAVPALAALFTLGILGLLGSPLTLFHALALLLIFGIGIDYSLFFAEDKAQGASVMLAVFLSACSTLLAFGLLILSDTPAIHYFGLTLTLGIAATFALTPFIHTLSRKVI